MKTLPLQEALTTLNLPGLERNLFSSPSWLAVIRKTYGTKIFVKYIERDHEIKSYIIYSIVQNFLEWKVCICSYCDYFDCYVTDIEDWQLFFAALRDEYPGFRIAIRNLRDTYARQNPNFTLLSKEWIHTLDIRAGLEQIWVGINDSFRSAVKQAEKNKVTIRIGGKAELRLFYEMYLKLRKQKYRIFPQPFRFFENIWEEFIEKDNGFLLCAYDREGNFIAATIYLICGDTLYYKSNTSDVRALKLRPNNLMFWEGVKKAKERQLEFVDLGSSGYDQEGLVLFKNHTGAKAMEIHHLGFAPVGYKFSEKRILKMYTRLFTMPWVPDRVVEWGSDFIYPFLA